MLPPLRTPLRRYPGPGHTASPLTSTRAQYCRGSFSQTWKGQQKVTLRAIRAPSKSQATGRPPGPGRALPPPPVHPAAASGKGKQPPAAGLAPPHPRPAKRKRGGPSARPKGRAGAGKTQRRRRRRHRHPPHRARKRGQPRGRAASNPDRVSSRSMARCFIRSHAFSPLRFSSKRSLVA